MARSDRDSWDLATSVGATATMVAAARAAASRRADPVINDPFAEPLVRAVGLDLFTRVATGEADFADIDGGVGFPRMTDTFAARAVFYDQFFADAGEAGVRQVVIVASGLDARPYRLSWPAGTTVYEVDQPEVIEFKTATLSKLGAIPTAEHRAVGIDLREDWPAALQAAGFDSGQPTAWLAEGVLIGFLPPEAEVRLLDNITALSAGGQPVRRRLWNGRRSIRSGAGTEPDHDRDLAQARPRSRHLRAGLPRRAHRCRGTPAGAWVGHHQVGAFGAFRCCRAGAAGGGR